MRRIVFLLLSIAEKHAPDAGYHQPQHFLNAWIAQVDGWDPAEMVADQTRNLDDQEK